MSVKPFMQFNGNPRFPEPKLPPAMPAPTVAAPTAVKPPMDSNAMIAALMAMMQQKSTVPPPIDFASLFGAVRNDPQGDANKAYMPGTNNAANPMTNGFFNQSAADLSPQARAASQGGTAMNQWAYPDLFRGSMPSSMTQAEGAASASPSPFQISPESSALVHGYTEPPGAGWDPSLFVPQQGPAQQRVSPTGGYGDTNFRNVPRATVAKKKKPAGMPAIHNSPTPGFNFQQLFR